MDALPAVATDALVHADFVDAGASVATWVTLAVVDVWNLKRRENVRLPSRRSDRRHSVENSGLTLMAVGASEALLALAAELTPGLAAAAPVRSTHIGRNVALSTRRAIGRHGDRAAVNHYRGERQLHSQTTDETCLNKGLVQLIKCGLCLTSDNELCGFCLSSVSK